MMYSDKVLDHFSNPRNVGEMADANGVGEVGNQKCGDIMKIYLKIENEGDVAFDYKLSVDMNSYTDGVNVYGESLHLPDHLRFGVIFGASEAELDRALARENAVNQMESYCLDTYSLQDTVSVAPGQVRYAALVVFMPEAVDNVANGRGDAPSVELGVGVYAQQAGTPMA